MVSLTRRTRYRGTIGIGLLLLLALGAGEARSEGFFEIDKTTLNDLLGELVGVFLENQSVRGFAVAHRITSRFIAPGLSPENDL